jgi:calmodulin
MFKWAGADFTVGFSGSLPPPIKLFLKYWFIPNFWYRQLSVLKSLQEGDAWIPPPAEGIYPAALKAKLTEEDAQNFVQEILRDHGADLLTMETIIDSPQNLHLASELFKTIDTNGSNSIDKEEMRRAVQVMAEAMPDVFKADEDMLNQFFANSSQSGGNTLDFDDWVGFLNQLYMNIGPGNFKKLAVGCAAALRTAFDPNLPTIDDKAKRAFAAFAKDEEIDKSSFSTVCRALGLRLTPTKEEALFQQVDANGDGKLQFDEFLTLVKETSTPMDKVQEVSLLYDAFRQLDLDGNGTVSLEEMRQVMCELGENPLTPAEFARFEAFFKRADVDGNGELTIEEYVSAHFTTR